MPFKVFHFISNSKAAHNDFPFFSRFILCLAHCSFIYCICQNEPSSLFVYLFLITSRFVIGELELPSRLFETCCEPTGKKRVGNYFNLCWIEVIKSALEDEVMPDGFNFKKVWVPLPMSWGLYSPNLGLVITLNCSIITHIHITVEVNVVLTNEGMVWFEHPSFMSATDPRSNNQFIRIFSHELTSFLLPSSESVTSFTLLLMRVFT
ncbi:hypothetical protein YC2023_017531 [Brassica napus]